MNIAIVHDRLDVMGGAERVIISLAKAFNADLYTLSYDQDETFRDAGEIPVKNLDIFKINEDYAPWIYPFYHFAAILRLMCLDLSDYDLVVTSGNLGHFAEGDNTIWYCHTPPRFLHDLKEFILEYLRQEYGVFAKFFAMLWWRFWKILDILAAEKPNLILANSGRVRRRVKNFYGREAQVVHPPVKTELFVNRPPENYFLSVQRPSPEQRIEIQLEVFDGLDNENLIMVGDYENKDYKKKIQRKVDKLENVEWFKRVTDEELVDLYSRCQAVIQTSKNEDFGIVPIEAMASGKPVIAVREGTFEETLIEGKTGILVDKPYVRNFIRQIKDFDNSDFDSNDCQEQAENFSEERFIEKMRGIFTIFNRN